MPRVGSEPTIALFERAKIGHALDRAATVISLPIHHSHILTKGAKKLILNELKFALV
jgi:hypothetical protein